MLSGGSINSPQLLQLSGIGDAAHPAGAGIEPRAPRAGCRAQPAGSSAGAARCRSRQKVTVNDALQSPWRKAHILWRYLTARSGPLASAPSPVGGFFKSRPEAATADLQFFMMPLSVDRPGVLDTASGYTFCVTSPARRAAARS